MTPLTAYNNNATRSRTTGLAASPAAGAGPDHGPPGPEAGK